MENVNPEDWINFNWTVRLINELFENGCFVSAHAESIRLEKFLAIFARREMAKEEASKHEN